MTTQQPHLIIPDHIAPLLDLPKVQLGRLLPGALLKDRKEKNAEIWFGEVLAENGAVVSAWIKIASPIKVAADLTGTVIANAMGLPTLDPMLIKIRKEYLLDSRLWGQHQTERVAFASLDKKGAKRVNNDPESSARILRKWRFLAGTIVIDEWLMNSDRTTGNLLTNGDQIWLADHGECFNGCELELWPYCAGENAPFVNQLFQSFYGNLTKDQKQAFSKYCLQFVRQAAQLPFGELESHLGLSNIVEPELSSRIVQFLKQRLQDTHSELCKRLGMPQLRLAQ